MMEIKKKEIHAENLDYIIRSAQEEDAKSLSEIRLKIDGETENLDREKGEAFLSVFDFQEIIKDDTKNLGNLFLVAVVNDKIVGYVLITVIDTLVEIHLLYVDNLFRNQKFGTKLMDYIINKYSNFRFLLEVSINNYIAIKLY